MAGWSFSVYVLLQICVILKAQSTNEEEGCSTPDRETGTCISIPTCKPIFDILMYVLQLQRDSQPIPPTLKDLLKSYHCGFDGNSHKVCCPSKPIKFDQHFTPSNQESKLEFPNVSGHRNFNLLPRDCGVVNTQNKIFYRNKIELFEFPWMALLSYKTKTGFDFKCAGTIINDRYILTAAHCINNNETSSLSRVRVGEDDISTETDCEQREFEEMVCAPPYQDLAIEEIIPHPQYDRKALANDIGLLRMVSRMNFTENVKPICLPVDKARNYNFTNKNVIITGWGSHFSPYLLKNKLPAIPLDECKRAYSNYNITLNYKQMCAGGEMRDICAGDSGGPLHVVDRLYDNARIIQHGIVSFGSKICGQIGFPDVYTRVTYYMDWILDNIKP